MTKAKKKANLPPIALNQEDAANYLGVGPEFFKHEVEPEIKIVRRGSRSLYPVGELGRWLEEHAELAGV